MASNGTGSAPNSPSPHLDLLSRDRSPPKRVRSASPGRAFPTHNTPPQLHHSDHDTYTQHSEQGRPSFDRVQPVQPTQPCQPHQPQLPQRGIPLWDPKALLNPKASSSAPPPSLPPNATSDTSSSPAGPSHNGFGPPAPQNQVFSFTSPDDDPAQLPPLPQANVNGGVGSMIERINNVDSRSSLPEPKRRKVDPTSVESGVNQTSRGGRGSSGLLGGYIKEKQQVEGLSRPLSTQLSNLTQTQTVDLTDGKDETDVLVVDNLGLQEVCFGMLDVASVNCHKVPAPRPGQTALAGEQFWPPVKTVLKRKVGDTSTTILVYDYTREIFGNIDAKTANALVPLLDSVALQLRTDCRIPSRRKQADEVLGQPISRAYKIEIILYGRRKFAKTVGRILRERSVTLLSPAMVNRGIQVVNPHAMDPRASTGGMRQKPPVSSLSYAPPPVSRTVEEVRSDVLSVFDSLSKSEELPEQEPDSLVQTELLPHQKQGLYFLTARETPALQSKHIGSLWHRKHLHGGQTAFLNVVTGQVETQKPPETLGGILADMMGLGKTLSILSLITSSLEKAKAWAELEPEQPVAQDRKKQQQHSRFHAPVPEPLGLTRLSRNARTTLLVCPLSTVTNWEEQIKQHIKPSSLSYHIYHGQNRIKDAAQLSDFDLVITTYGSVSSELTARNKRKANKAFPLEEIGWFRIVLDEAHMIREQSTLQFKAICRLQASRRWAVTGTPVQNRLDDLAALLAFLRLRPFDDRNKFNQFIVTPFKNADPEILPKLRVLVDTITLRRLKDKIHLPPRTDHVVKLRFSPEERRLYDLFARNAKERVQVLTANRERILGGKTYIHILKSILRLRLICAHGRELLNEEDLKAVEGMTQESAIDLDSDDEPDKPSLLESQAYSMFDLMKETDGDACVMCQRKLGSNDDADIESERQEDVLGYMTPCYHLYCRNCVRQFRDEERGISHASSGMGECPICHIQVKFSCVELRHTRADVEHEDSEGSRPSFRGAKKLEAYGGPHTKTRALVEDLVRARDQSDLEPDEPPIKSVVFSGWTSHLDLIQIALDRAGIGYTRLDGKMTRLARAQAMDTFRDDAAVQVILVSIMAGGLGLNLTAGSNVYVMEPQYNPAAEAQAVDRVHRLGQKRAVRTVRYIMEDSFEEQMVQLQDKKIKLASLSMDRTDRAMDKREAAKQRLLDLKTLFK